MTCELVILVFTGSLRTISVPLLKLAEINWRNMRGWWVAKSEWLLLQSAHPREKALPSSQRFATIKQQQKSLIWVRQYPTVCVTLTTVLQMRGGQQSPAAPLRKGER